jgi:hypothetical protein
MKYSTEVNANWLNRPSASCSAIFSAVLGIGLGWRLLGCWALVDHRYWMRPPDKDEGISSVAAPALIVVLSLILGGLAGFVLGKRKRRDFAEMRNAALNDDDAYHIFEPSHSEANESIRRALPFFAR